MSSLIRRPIAWIIFLLAFQALTPAKIDNIDGALRLELAKRLRAHGSLFFPSELATTELTVPGLNGPTTIWGIGQTLALVPIEWVAEVASRLSPFDGLSAEAIVMLLYCPLVSVLWLCVLAACARELGIAVGSARGWSFTVFMASLLGFYGAQSLQEESLLGLCASLALFSALRWKATGSSAWAAAIGAALGMGYLIKPTVLLVALPLLGLLHDVRRTDAARVTGRTALVLFAACTAAFLPFLGLDLLSKWLRFGSISVNPHTLLARYGDPDFFALGAPRPSVAFALLFGLGKGVFVLSPVLLIGACFACRSRTWRGYGIGTISAIVLSAIAHSALRGTPDGAWSWGARYQVHLLSLLVPLTLLGIMELKQSGRGIVVTRALIACGLVVQALAVFAPNSLEYFQHVRFPPAASFEKFLESGSNGQLATRTHNALHYARTRKLETFGSEYGPMIERIAATSVPNLWVVHLARKQADDLLRVVLFLLWLIQLGALVVLLRTSLSTTRGDIPPANFKPF